VSIVILRPERTFVECIGRKNEVPSARHLRQGKKGSNVKVEGGKRRVYREIQRGFSSNLPLREGGEAISQKGGKGEKGQEVMP